MAVEENVKDVPGATVPVFVIERVGLAAKLLVSPSSKSTKYSRLTGNAKITAGDEWAGDCENLGGGEGNVERLGDGGGSVQNVKNGLVTSFNRQN